MKTCGVDALLFIGFNGSRAPIWRFTYDKRYSTESYELAQSESAKERSDAPTALTKSGFSIRMTAAGLFVYGGRSSSDVRWRVAFGSRTT